MIKLTDNTKTVEIEMNHWTGSGYTPDWSNDFSRSAAWNLMTTTLTSFPMWTTAFPALRIGRKVAGMAIMMQIPKKLKTVV